MKDAHADNYTGTDDDMYESYERFIENLDTKDLIDFADIYGLSMYTAGQKIEIEKQLAKFKN